MLLMKMKILLEMTMPERRELGPVELFACCSPNQETRKRHGVSTKAKGECCAKVALPKLYSFGNDKRP